MVTYEVTSVEPIRIDGSAQATNVKTSLVAPSRFMPNRFGPFMRDLVQRPARHQSLPFVGLALPLLPARSCGSTYRPTDCPASPGQRTRDPTAMRRPPRPPTEPVLGARLWQRVARVGLAIAPVTIGVGA